MKTDIGIKEGAVAVFAFNSEWRYAKVKDEANIKTGRLEIIHGLYFRADGQDFEGF